MVFLARQRVPLVGGLVLAGVGAALARVTSGGRLVRWSVPRLREWSECWVAWRSGRRTSVEKLI